MQAATAGAALHSGSGSTDYGVKGIYSSDFATAYHVDVNYGVIRLGGVGPAEGRWQGQWAAALSSAIDDRWSLEGEFSGTQQPGAERTVQGLLAVGFTPSHRISWDVGIARGLTAATSRWSLFAGATVLGLRL